MKILYVNWAPLWKGAAVGGGVNSYSQSMAVRLARNGQQLYSISSGYSYNLLNRVYIKKANDYMGVKNYEIINTPNMAPGSFNYRTPLNDVSEPVVERVFEEFIKWLKPDVVHFHNIEGFSAQCISLARRNGARVLFSLHNYHPVCSQVYLLYKHRDICVDFDNGKKCVHCIHPPSRNSAILQRRLAYYIRKMPWGEESWRRLGDTSRFKVVQKMVKELQSSDKGNGLDPQVDHTFYAKRRKFIIDALNEAHVVHAVSEFVKRYYVDMGIRGDIVRTCHIGNRMADQKPLPPTGTYNAAGPVNIIFLGVALYPKGLSFLLNTLGRMKDEVLKRIHLHVYAKGWWVLQEDFSKLRGRIHSMKVHDGYEFSSLPTILSGKDLGVVPPLWYDNAPQVVFEMLAMKVPVIGAQIGGIPDFVKHMENGILFEAGNGEDFADALETAVMNKGLVLQLKKNIRPMKTLDQHTGDLKNLYET